MNLRERQRHVRDLLVDEAIDETALAPGMAIYRNAYRSRLLETLQNGFPRTLAWIGNDAFDEAARHYILQRPPRSFTLDDYGSDFASTLHTLFRNDPEVAELAWLEWSMQQAFGAVDEPVLDTAGFAAAVASDIDWASISLRTVHSVALTRIASQCTVIWQALADLSTPPTTLLLDQPGFLLVWRHGLVPRYRMLGAREHAALAQLARGCTLPELAEADMPAEDDAAGEHDGAATLGDWLASWIAAGLIALPAALAAAGMDISAGAPAQHGQPDVAGHAPEQDLA